MLAMLGSWLGLDTTTPDAAAMSDETASPAASTASSASAASPSLSISKTPRRARSATIRRTKSTELLASAELISFLCEADEAIKVNETPLDQCAVDRLEALQAQAALDDCDVLADIVDHLQDENDRLKRAIAQRRFGGSADRPLCAWASRSLVC